MDGTISSVAKITLVVSEITFKVVAITSSVVKITFVVTEIIFKVVVITVDKISLFVAEIIFVVAEITFNSIRNHSPPNPTILGVECDLPIYKTLAPCMSDWSIGLADALFTLRKQYSHYYFPRFGIYLEDRGIMVLGGLRSRVVDLRCQGGYADNPTIESSVRVSSHPSDVHIVCR